MNRSCCCYLVFTFLLIVIGDALLFSWFLHHFETRKTAATTTDMVPINTGLSTFWCEGVTLESTLQFNAYKLSSQPRIEDGKLQTDSNSFSYSMTAYENVLQSFFLLEGSFLKVSLCASERLAFISVFKASEDAEHCVKEMHDTFDDPARYDDIGKDDVSCKHSLLINQVMVASDCNANGGWWRSRQKGMDVANIHVYESGYYYILVQNFNHRTLNHIEMEIKVSRTLYAVNNKKQKCKHTKRCHFNYDFVSDESVVAEVLPSKRSDKFINTTIYSTCDLNNIVLIVVFLVVPLTLFLILCCACCCLCFKKKQTEVIYIRKKQEKGHLLPSKNIDIKKNTDNQHKTSTEAQNSYGATNIGFTDNRSRQMQPNVPETNYYQPPPQYNAVPPYNEPVNPSFSGYNRYGQQNNESAPQYQDFVPNNQDSAPPYEGPMARSQKF